MSVSLLFHSIAILMHLEVTPLFMEPNQQSMNVVLWLKLVVPTHYTALTGNEVNHRVRCT